MIGDMREARAYQLGRAQRYQTVFGVFGIVLGLAMIGAALGNLLIGFHSMTVVSASEVLSLILQSAIPLIPFGVFALWASFYTFADRKSTLTVNSSGIAFTKLSFSLKTIQQLFEWERVAYLRVGVKDGLTRLLAVGLDTGSEVYTHYFDTSQEFVDTMGRYARDHEVKVIDA